MADTVCEERVLEDPRRPERPPQAESQSVYGFTNAGRARARLRRTLSAACFSISGAAIERLDRRINSRQSRSKGNCSSIDTTPYS